MNTLRALIVAPTLPEFDREGGSRDIADLIGFLVDAQWSVTFVCRSAAGGDRYVKQLRRQGVEVHVAPDGLPTSVTEGLAPDVVVLAFWHLAEDLLPAVRSLWPETRVVVSSIDLHFVRDARRIFGAVGRGDRSFLLDGFYADTLIRELNTYAVADAVLAVSEKEASLVGDLTGDPDLGWWVPVTQGEERSPVPFAERQGLLFVGNFQHAPNVEAVEYLCSEIVPRIDPEVLMHHPVMIVGNAPDDRVRKAVATTPGARLVGWVPSLTPYLQRACVSLVPLLHGAGVKGKLVRSLAAGTPCVSTSVGVEGLGLRVGTDVLVADDPVGFAAGIARLVQDQSAWEGVADSGQARIAGIHGPAAVRERLFAAFQSAMSRPPKSAALAEQLEAGKPNTRYGELARKLRLVAQRKLPADVPVLVVSKGDDDLIDIDGVRVEHFPQDEHGGHLGWHPPDGADVSARLDAQRQRGQHYFVLPATSMWWLQHYDGLAHYLEEHYQQAVREDDTCVIWHYPGQPAFGVADDAGTQAPVAVPGAASDVVVAVHPSVRPIVDFPPPVPGHGEVLVVGVYVATKPNYADDIVAVIDATEHHHVTQVWASLGAAPPTDRLAEHTGAVVMERRPKFQIANELLATVDLDRFEYIVLVDDDLALPHGFIDHLLGWQRWMGYALAQPSRTARSFTDHRIVEQQRGSVARRTRFVEIGPVTSFHRSVFPLLLPFDLTSPMGWGYENIWTHQVETAGLTMGIIDAVPVDHSLRPPVAHYSWDEADAGREAILAAHPHVPLEECFRVLEVVAVPEQS
ncbi:MAG: hypothetical protein QOI20_2421 [Acidimicrobiaceae bacterium]|jgi:glycosyltransferase involved in cell wall biosynthesis|nr:hypothetical protein [Acidimicrobiaceae bacterium]